MQERPSVKLRTTERKKEQILDTLDTKVQCILAMRRDVDRYQEKKDGSFADYLERIWKKRLAVIPPEERQKFRQWMVLHEMSSRLENEWIAYDQTRGDQDLDEIVSDQKDERFLERINTLRTKEDRLTSGSRYIEFLAKLLAVKQDLIKKHKKVDQLTLDPEPILKELKLPITAKDVIRVEKRPASLVFTIQKEAFDQMRKKSLGLYFRRTPYIFLRSDADKESTLRHEEIHNETQAVIETKNPVHSLKKMWNYYQRQKENPITREHAKAYLLDSEKFVNQLHGEILAAFEKEQMQNSAPESFGEFLLRRALPIPDAYGYARFITFYQTAGNQALDFRNEIQNLAKTADEEDRELLFELERDFVYKIHRISEWLQKIAEICSSLPPTASLELEAIPFILNPSQYNHIFTYFEYKYPGQVKKIEQGIRSSDFFSCSELVEVVHFLETERVSPKIARKIYDRFEQLAARGFLGESEEAELDSLASFRKYRDLVGRAARLFARQKITGIDPKANKMVFLNFADRLEYAFCDGVLSRELKNQYAGLPVLCAQLTDQEKGGLKDAFMIIYEGGILYEDLEDLGLIEGKDPPNEIKKLPIWEVLKKIGFVEEESGVDKE
ncbi:MAG TPA: hypothetical protein VFQ60_03480 [Patescibacteria group bacterium]|nr:hypothetical protein [Patescibacteria group bacterium]